MKKPGKENISIFTGQCKGLNIYPFYYAEHYNNGDDSMQLICLVFQVFRLFFYP
jgi:hypothetical protein